MTKPNQRYYLLRYYCFFINECCFLLNFLNNKNLIFNLFMSDADILPWLILNQKCANK